MQTKLPHHDSACCVVVRALLCVEVIQQKAGALLFEYTYHTCACTAVAVVSRFSELLPNDKNLPLNNTRP